MAKPIVASTVGGIPEIIKDNETGFLCNLSDSEQWIRRIRFLIENPEDARVLGKNAREFVMKTFNPRKIAIDFKEDLMTFPE